MIKAFQKLRGVAVVFAMLLFVGYMAALTWGVIRVQHYNPCDWIHERGSSNSVTVTCLIKENPTSVRFDILGISLTALGIILAAGALLSINSITERAIASVVKEVQSQVDATTNNLIAKLKAEATTIMSNVEQRTNDDSLSDAQATAFANSQENGAS